MDKYELIQMSHVSYMTWRWPEFSWITILYLIGIAGCLYALVRLFTFWFSSRQIEEKSWNFLLKLLYNANIQQKHVLRIREVFDALPAWKKRKILNGNIGLLEKPLLKNLGIRPEEPPEDAIDLLQSLFETSIRSRSGNPQIKKGDYFITLGSKANLLRVISDSQDSFRAKCMVDRLDQELSEKVRAYFYRYGYGGWYSDLSLVASSGKNVQFRFTGVNQRRLGHNYQQAELKLELEGKIKIGKSVETVMLSGVTEKISDKSILFRLVREYPEHTLDTSIVWIGRIYIPELGTLSLNGYIQKSNISKFDLFFRFIAEESQDFEGWILYLNSKFTNQESDSVSE